MTVVVEHTRALTSVCVCDVYMYGWMCVRLSGRQSSSLSLSHSFSRPRGLLINCSLRQRTRDSLSLSFSNVACVYARLWCYRYSLVVCQAVEHMVTMWNCSNSLTLLSELVARLERFDERDWFIDSRRDAHRGLAELLMMVFLF